MGRFDDRVVFITGAARGQGRSHAVRFAEEGADVIAVDICEQLETIAYPMATEDDLAETVRLVEEQGRRVCARKADVRDLAVEMTAQEWREMVAVDQTGVWYTCKAAIPHMLEGKRGGAIILTSSEFGQRGGAYIAHYVAAKHAVVGTMRSLAIELGPSSIRVNCVHPTEVNTPMLMNEAFYGWLCPDVELTGVPLPVDAGGSLIR